MKLKDIHLSTRHAAPEPLVDWRELDTSLNNAVFALVVITFFTQLYWF